MEDKHSWPDKRKEPPLRSKRQRLTSGQEDKRRTSDACKPFEWMNEFPEFAESSPEYINAVRKKWRQLF
jgi:hypothetical protein